MSPRQTTLEDGTSVTLVHLLRDGRIACMPNMATEDMSSGRGRAAPHMRTDSADPDAVTCRACRGHMYNPGAGD